eukprot:gene3459-2541_t
MNRDGVPRYRYSYDELIALRSSASVERCNCSGDGVAEPLPDAVASSKDATEPAHGRSGVPGTYRTVGGGGDGAQNPTVPASDANAD